MVRVFFNGDNFRTAADIRFCRDVSIFDTRHLCRLICGTAATKESELTFALLRQRNIVVRGMKQRELEIQDSPGLVVSGGASQILRFPLP